MSEKLATSLSAFRETIRRVLVLREFLHLFATWSFIWGAVVLLGRALRFWPDPSLETFFVGFPGACILAWVRSAGDLPADEVLTALFDRHNACGGLLMVSELTGSQAWADRVGEISAPDLRWNVPARLLLLPLLGVGFAIAATLIPTTTIVPPVPGALHVNEEVKRLSAEIEILRQEELLTASQAEKLLERLEGLKAAGSGEDPAGTWEALDHLEQAAARSAREGTQETLARAEKLSAAQNALEEALKNTGGASFSFPADMPDLAKMLERASATIPVGHGGSGSLDPTASMTRDAAASLAATLGSMRSSALARLDRLGKAVKLDSATLARLGAMKPISLIPVSLMTATGIGSCTATMAVIIPGSPGDKPSSCTALLSADSSGGKDDKPGSGGISRGRGDARMHFGEATSEQNARFQEQVLPPNERIRLEDMQTVGVAMSAPQPSQQVGPSTGGVLTTGNTAQSTSALTRTILPRHRSAVRRFFQRK
ncbi:MAG: hypothetical protein WA705_09725 [Candidatus Ozemobacteraceae bacterium]